MLVMKRRQCIDNLDEFADSKFPSTAYLVMENYASGTNCQALSIGTINVADGKCHLNATDDSYF
ncbi:hypothetical protein GN958_ATG08821 [Phytophthora infestans]|uniref:Uncharacterized protein n=1 Tax=Phytophthora infestans TaxID=4787 RepID=A0A8S9URE7_PHYIN|nr:hypothetical protein GN958_ATG08821 [Phytophthora infestans]